MPAFVIVPAGRISEPVDGVLCDPGIAGGPDRETDVPVRVQLFDRTLAIDGEVGPHRRILSNIGDGAGHATILVEGSTRSIPDRERRRSLARADALTHQLAMILRPLIPGSENAGLATDGLGLLFNRYGAECGREVNRLKRWLRPSTRRQR